MTTTTPRKWALITGVTPGSLVESLSSILLTRGINIIATSSEPKDITYLHPEPGSNHGFLITLQMDVTSPRSIKRAIEQISRLTDRRLDFLLHGESAKYLVPILDADLAQAKRVWDITVWGAVRTVQAAFPLLKESGGVFVTFSASEDEEQAFEGFVSSSRGAVGSLSKALRMELRPFGVSVVCLDVPTIRMDEIGDRGGGGIGEESVYWPIRDEVEAAMERAIMGEKGKDRFEVAEKMVEELLDGQAMNRQAPLTGWQIMLITLLSWILPSWMVDGLNTRAAGLNKLGRSIPTESAILESKKKT